MTIKLSIISGTNSLVKYFVDFSSQFQLINPLRSLESYSHFLRALQLQHSDIKNFLAQRYLNYASRAIFKDYIHAAHIHHLL